MTHDKVSQEEQEKVMEERSYTPPAIIYTGLISTRAGSPLGGDGGVDPVDLLDLFGE